VMIPSEALSRRLGPTMLYLIERPSRYSWEVDLPSADEKGLMPDVVEVKVFDDLLSASRLLRLNINILRRIVRDEATRLDRFEARDARESLTSLLTDVSYSSTEASCSPVDTGDPVNIYPTSSISSAPSFPLTRIYNAFGELGAQEIGKPLFRSTGPPGIRSFGKIV
jgi:hypothetical protein